MEIICYNNEQDKKEIIGIKLEEFILTWKPGCDWHCIFIDWTDNERDNDNL